MKSNDNKRKYSRLKRSLIAKFRLHKEKDPSRIEKWDIVTIRNISAGGLSFNYHNKIPAGAILEFNLELAFSVGHISCLGVVRRVDETPSEGKPPVRILIHGIAVEFLDIDGEKQKSIDKLVQEFQGK